LLLGKVMSFKPTAKSVAQPAISVGDVNNSLVIIILKLAALYFVVDAH
jgi:hypothetical protein